MGILHSHNNKKDDKAIAFSLASSKNLLLVFTRNPELGKCKTRLAAKVGDSAALEIYLFLLRHTVRITQDLYARKWVCYSEEIWENDVWDNIKFEKKLQRGVDLGERMYNAFAEGFSAGFEKIVIIGSDMYDLGQTDLEDAFKALNDHNYVLGPALDGGYYLLGMKALNPELFKDKPWGTDKVLKKTLENLKNSSYFLLEVRNDIDLYKDIKDNPAFAPFLKHLET